MKYMAKSKKSVKKRRIFTRISYKERVIIENRYRVDRRSISYIAKELKRPASTISREIGGKPRVGAGKYSADIVQVQVEKTKESRKKNEIKS